MKKVLIITLTILLIVLIGSGAYIYNMLNQIQENPVVNPDTGEPVKNRGELGINDNAPVTKDTGIKNILLLGIDSRTKDEPARSDSIMIASIDKKNSTVKITSLMRDMYVPIPGKKDNRINTAYIFGGPSLSIKTINTNFNMDIEDYVEVDFFSLETIINEVGGVPIEIKRAEVKVINQYINNLNDISTDGTKTPRVTTSGIQTLTGRQAVAYCRIRYVGRDDFERTERQRRVLNELFKKGKSIGLSNIPNLVAKILPDVQTSLSKTEIIELGIAMLGFSTENLEQSRIPADSSYSDEWVGDMLVLKPDLVKNTELLHNFIYGTAE